MIVKKICVCLHYVLTEVTSYIEGVTKMLYRVNEAETIDPTSQMHYRFHRLLLSEIL